MNLINPSLTSSVDWQLLKILIWSGMLFLSFYHRHMSIINEAEHVSISNNTFQLMYTAQKVS